MSTENIIPLNTNPLTLKRALISVSDKSGIVELAQGLVSNGIEIISTGGTYNTIKKAGIDVTEVSELTKFPECLDGRVKTLHPVIHAGILARTSYEDDIKTLASLNIEAFELVVVNLYPFAQTIAKPDTALAKAVEFVDIGGPTMVRAAAKNFPHVCILTNPMQYHGFIKELDENKKISYNTRLHLSRDAFQHTATYDIKIANYLTDQTNQIPAKDFNVSLPLAQSLRYG